MENDRTLRRNFGKSCWASCTFNFGPHAVTIPHRDIANLAWGWCAITAIGEFDSTRGGHLVLWDLGLVIQFPAGSTILIPSAIVTHSNIPVSAHENRHSVTQYTAGALFRWVENGCCTDKALLKDASDKQKAERQSEKATRWERGLEKFTM
jgi:hypothetical protein